MVGNLGLSAAVRRGVLTVMLTLSLGILAACDSSEERAEAHYQSAIELLEKGDVDRAIIEFRNVFDLNGRHYEARTAYANLLRERGNVRQSISQYLRLVEQYPEDIDGNRALAEMYAEIGNWPEMERYLTAVLSMDPKDDSTQALKIVFLYRQAVEDRDFEAQKAAVAAAVEMKSLLPEHIMIRQVIIDHQIRSNKFGSALAELDEAIEIEPNQRNLFAVRLSVLGALGDSFEIEAQLKDMIERFPDDDSSRVTLVRWYVSQDQLDDAESFLRGAIDPESDDQTEYLTLLRFLSELRGPETALAEVEQMISAGKTAPIFLSLKAGLKFELGDLDQAIAEMRTILEGMPPSDESRLIKMGLAQMLLTTGDKPGARVLVDEILVEDKSHVGALKLKAGWLIDEDEVGEAIVALRTALDQSPRDAEIITLMASAHDRDGSHELVGEMLSLAVDASNRAPDESIRYARFLQASGKFSTSESILVDALRLAPTNIGILSELGKTYLGLKEWARAKQVVETLHRQELPEATSAANELNARLLQAQENISEAIAFLEGLVAEGSAGFNANFAIVRTHLGTGEFERARSYVDSLLADDPENMGVQFMDAAVDAATGEVAKAEATYRSLLQKDDQQVQVWIALFRLVISDGRTLDSEIVIDEAQAALPDDPTLKWIKAGLLENAGDLEGAIAIYEGLYKEDSSNLIVANNLASLLTSTREDAESIGRAFTIARRLRSTTVAPYQDTYGWIAFLRGETGEAIAALEPAARSLASDPTVQYHLARAYVAAGRPQDAAVQYEKVISLTGPADTRDFVVFSRSEIGRLEADLANAIGD